MIGALACGRICHRWCGGKTGGHVGNVYQLLTVAYNCLAAGGGDAVSIFLGHSYETFQ